MTEMQKLQTAYTKIKELEELIYNNQCPHYNDDPPCERCFTECPFDAVKQTLRKLQHEIALSTNKTEI